MFLDSTEDRSDNDFDDVMSDGLAELLKGTTPYVFILFANYILYQRRNL